LPSCPGQDQHLVLAVGADVAQQLAPRIEQPPRKHRGPIRGVPAHFHDALIALDDEVIGVPRCVAFQGGTVNEATQAPITFL
jgi:hypothetical protein